MKVLLKKKKILLRNIVLFLVLFVLTLCGLVFIDGIKNKENVELQSANNYPDIDIYYYFDSEDESLKSFKGKYNSYEQYRIVNFLGLKVFEEAVESGYTFSGKTVYLYDNINCEGAEVCIGQEVNDTLGYGKGNYFQGIFDGCGYTISNFKSTKSVNIDKVYDTVGFFTVLGNAFITNLRLKGFKLTGGNYYAGLVGQIKANTSVKIRNCIIENVSYDNTASVFAGIVARGEPDEVLNCKFVNITKKLNYVICLDQSETSKYDGIVIKSCKYDCVVKRGSPTNVKTSAKDVLGLDFSSVGGADHDSAWYYAADYNEGWPELRIFIKNWKRIGFGVVGDSESGKVSPSLIQIPENADLNDGFHINGSSGHIYDQAVVATPAPGYVFDYWSGQWVRFRREQYILKFTGLKQYGAVNDTVEYTVHYGTKIWASIKHNKDNTIVTYIIEEWDGTIIESSIMVHKKYTIDSYGEVKNIEIKETEIIVPDMEDGELCEIAPTFKLKNYNIEFK